MHLDDAESALLKPWIVTRLAAISDADSDVLADYVLALVKTDDPEAVAKANCVENLKDFLLDHTASFVNDVYTAVHTKAYDPSRPPLKPTAPVYQPPRRTSYEGPRLPNQGRKRSYHDWDAARDQDERPSKLSRRGGGGFEQAGGHQAYTPAWQPAQAATPPMPTPPPGMPAFDPSNPFAPFLAMQQMMSMMPAMPMAGSPHIASPTTGQRCRDYDTQGFCTRGVSCPYEHGESPYVVPDQAQMSHQSDAAMATITPVRFGSFDMSPPNGISTRSPRGRGRGGLGAAGRRAHINHNHQTLVVENIPEDHFDEANVRHFFSQFGNIKHVSLQLFRRLAIVKYDTNAAARAAYESPKSVFDNRFVRVFWYKWETFPRPAHGRAADESFDEPLNEHTADERAATLVKTEDDVKMEEAEEVEEEKIDLEVARRQEAAQRKQDEAKKQRETAEQQRQELDEKLLVMDQERRRLQRLLVQKTGEPVVEEPHASEKTKALQAQLAKLEAEARSLGIDPNAYSIPNSFDGFSPSYRGRGGFRGRPGGRGGYRGSYRGGYAPSPRGSGSVMRLDNRPKTVMAIFLDGSSYNDNEEALRSYFLLGDMEHVVLAQHPERADGALVAFQQRYEGDNFMAAVSVGAVPQMGRVELSWFAEPAAMHAVNGHGEKDVKAENVDQQFQVGEPTDENGEVDNAAEDDDLDRWGG